MPGMMRLPGLLQLHSPCSVEQLLVFLARPCGFQMSHTPRTLQQIFTEQILSLETVSAGMGAPMLDSILICF